LTWTSNGAAENAIAPGLIADRSGPVSVAYRNETIELELKRGRTKFVHPVDFTRK